MVGPPNAREDLSGQSDRALIVRLVDGILSLEQSIAKAMVTMGDLSTRVALLERPRLMTPQQDDPEISSHDWNALLREAGHELSKRVQDPRDHLDSDRAKAIAREVYQASRTEDDLKAYRAAGARVWKIAFALMSAALTIMVSLFVWAITKR
jgi:hypothetical protein